MSPGISRRDLLRDVGLAAVAAGAVGIIPSQAAQAHAGATTFYVAVGGNDAWSGHLADPNGHGTDGPFATLARARDAVRALKSGGPLTGPVDIVIRRGTYYLNETLELTPDDSGTQRCPVTWRAADGEHVTISGGRPITGTWSAEADGVYSTTIANPWAFRTLFVDGRRATLARYPNPDPDNPGAGYLYNGGQNPNLILAGLAQGGDYVTYRLTVAAAGDYDLWLGWATTETAMQQYLTLAVDGQPAIPLSPITASGGFRTVAYSRATAGLSLSAGTHQIRLNNVSPPGEDHRAHLDALVLTTDPAFAPTGAQLPPPAPGEQRVIVQAEDDTVRIAGYSSIRFQKFSVTDTPSSLTTLYPDPSRVKPSWKDDPQALVDVVSVLQYFNEQCPISDIDATTGAITVTRTNTEAFQTSNYFFVSGVRAELDTPGEFYLDPTTGRLDYLPLPGQDPSTSVFLAPRLDRLVNLTGDATGTARVQWVRFHGLTFSHTTAARDYPSYRSPTDAAIQLDCAWHCTIDRCHITAVDGYGIWLHLDSCQNTISDNEIDDTGVGGVLLSAASLDYGIVYDPRPEVANYAPLRNSFVRNHIHHGGMVRVVAAGFNLGSRPESTALSAGNLIAFNHVHDMPRQGVFAFRNQGGNIIAYNNLHDLVTATADAGAINFAVMTNLAAANLVRNNVVDHVPGLFRFGEANINPYGFGLYIDQNTSNSWSENNLVTGASYSMFVDGGAHNVLFNSIAADPGQLWYADVAGILRDNRSIRNVVANTTTGVPSAAGADSYFLSAAAPFASVLAATPSLIVASDLNVLWNAGPNVVVEPQKTLAAWRARGEDPHSLAADPKFRAPAAGDYRLRPTSPALRLGMRPVDHANVGPTTAGAPAFDITSMAAVHVEAAATRSADGRTATYTPQVSAAGLYRAYARRTSQAIAPQKLAILVDAADGQNRSVYSDWAGPGHNPDPLYGIYLGTYRLDAGGAATVTFFQPGAATPDLPTSVQFIRVARLANSAGGVLWHLTAAARSTRMAAGQTTTLSHRALAGDGTSIGLPGATVRYASDAPAVASVDRNGRVTARGDGVAHLTVTATLHGITVTADPVTVIVGSILWEATLTAERGLLAPGDTGQLTVAGRTDDGGAADLSGATVTYTSSDSEVLTVDTAGLVSAHAVGTATVSASVTLANVTLDAALTLSVATSTTPALWYTFDESTTGNTDALDQGGAPAAGGTFHGAATRTATTPGAGSRAALDLTVAGNNYVAVSASKLDALSPFSLTLWTTLRGDPATFDRFISKGTSFDWQITGGTAGAVESTLSLGAATVRIPTFDASDWQFFAFVAGSTGLTVYRATVDAAVQAVATLPSAVGLPAGEAQELRIGGTSRAASTDRTPPAYLDDLRVYPVVLPVAELERIRTQLLTP
ncbi:hypothetical protein GCM10023322_10260 [Rugosimonospora acidiphila]|uniref:BIG2 domain-containing protein n=1 Tax=Rugosimonospora acidiphila TaxID=556531 RepID=A0ABP9RMS9_9ACTN